MSGIRITNFGGIIPRTSPRLTPDNAAQIAFNCQLSSGELIPFKDPGHVYSSSKVGLFASIYRIEDGGSSAWLGWATDVDVVKATLYGTARWCFTGDGEPRITTLADAVFGGADDYPKKFYTLGTPKPVTAPSVAPTGGSSAILVERYYAYTFYAAWGDADFEGAVSPISSLVSGKVDATWAITTMNTTPPSSGTVTGAYASSKTEFTDTVDHFLRVGEEVTVTISAVTYTLAVTDITSTKKFKVAGDYHTAVAWARKAPFPGTLYKRLYRSTGTTGQFQLVAEGITGTTYNDTLTDAQILGNELVSASWEMPAVGLKGLFSLPSGALGGFIGNKALFSEPLQPHAWPAEYAMQADYEIVGAECFGTGVALATTAWPFVIQGTEPGRMSGESWKESLPCVSKRSVENVGDAVMYASNSGIISINGAGATVWSLPYFTEKEFALLMPETMIAAFVERRLYVLYHIDGVSRTLIFNLNGDAPYLTETNFDADVLHGSLSDGRLYFCSGPDIYQTDPEDGYPMTQDWQSKEIVLPSPQNIGAAKVTFKQAIDPAELAAIELVIAAIEVWNAALLAAGDVRGSWNSMSWNATRWNGSELAAIPTRPPQNTVTLMFYADGVLRCSKTVVNNRAFTLASGYKSDAVSVRVQSQCLIRSIELGQTPATLGQA